MPKSKNSLLSDVVAGLSGLFGGKRKQKDAERAYTLSGAAADAVANQPFGAFWLFLKGAPGKIHEGMTCLPQWQWPDKDKYGQAKDGSIHRRTPKIPYRVRRWRKRAAARIAKRQGHTLGYAKQVVKNIEAGVVRDVIRRKQTPEQQLEAAQA